MPLTQLDVDRAQAVARRLVIDDEKIPGLKLIAYTNGVKEYVLQYKLPRRNASLSQVVVGNHPAMSLDQARKAARGLARDIRRGVHPNRSLPGATMGMGSPGFFGILGRILLAIVVGVLAGAAKGAPRKRRRGRW